MKSENYHLFHVASKIFTGRDPIKNQEQENKRYKKNNKKYIPGKFSWQDGHGAFTYSKPQIDMVVKYILNQPEHHRKQSFKDENLLFLKKFDVDYNLKYLFERYDNI